MPPKDRFHQFGRGLEAPAAKAKAVVTNDNNDLETTSRSIYVGTEGHVTVHMKGETTPLLFSNVPVGILPIRVDRILATGTTASNIVALW